MSERHDPFEQLDAAIADLKPKERPKPRIEEQAIEALAEGHNFPSRQAPKAPRVQPRKPRLHRTGRNVQFNAKATAETRDRFYRICDEQNLMISAGFERAVEALEAMTPLVDLARRRRCALRDIVKDAVEALERAGG